MTPFLQQVARAYAVREADSLPDFCFVFPNKRSATFFTHFLKEELAGHCGILPEVTNITDFVASFSDLSEANRYDQLFTLFDEYRKMPDADADFDKFVFWGDMLISDFNDVDRYLVDADALFVNVKRLREISSNYLTDEQREVIRRYWGEERGSEETERFWNHLEKEDKTNRHPRFVKLWNVLQPLYHAYCNRLREKGLASSGMLYRNAVKRVAEADAPELPFARYIFVGFNVLSTAEIKILATLQKRGLADFYWDFNSPAFAMEDSRAARFMRRNVREFPSRYSLEEEMITSIPEIEILGVPSEIGQVKATGHTISQWVKTEVIDNPGNAIDTAVVLPDESLFIPMIHSVPVVIDKLNVTMGFPMRLSPMSSLLHNIVSLQLRSRLRSDGRLIYFYEDVRTLLNAPAMRAVNPDGCAALEREIQSKRLFSIPAELIARLVPELSPVFLPIEHHDDRREVHAYISRLCDFLDSTLKKGDEIQHRFVESYRKAANELFDAADRFGIEMMGSSSFRLIERALSSDTVRFVGEPLQGLQLMGVLETRALDFKNIIMLSMNERVFPRRHYTRSFIPDALRYGYGMSTIDFQESIFAYYFYRLISRAEHVTLVYDARATSSNMSNEMSRYIAQLLYFFRDKDKISHKLGLYSAQRFTPPPISVTKDDAIMEKMKRFLEGGSSNLSASAINCYINCPLCFYLQYVEGFNAENEVTDYMDSSTYGTVVHAVAQRIYEGLRPEGSTGPVTVTESMLSHLMDPANVTVDRYITEAINRCYNHLPDDKLQQPLVGESLVLGKVIRTNLNAMLRIDMGLCPFTFIGAEHEMKGVLKINDELTINVKQIIDRIDKVGDRIRFVDYKTGSDQLSATSISSLFDTNQDRRAKAILQLLLYCHIYNTLEGKDLAIQPVVYKMLDLALRGVVPLKIGEPLFDYHVVADEFLDCLRKKIGEMFDRNVPFVQAQKPKNCTFCQFKAMCGRE